ncbi:DinB family protein [Rubrivirga sp.]|uniref:DinB family protein n=1 Tax=Rubrivirga sp. TaxID=1885344 RepID=UPI003B522E58
MTDLKAPFVEARDRLDALVDGLPDDVFNAKPSAKGWSAAECVVHLNRTAKGYMPYLEEAVARTEPRGQGPFRYGWVGRRFIAAVTPGSRAIPTLPAMKPPSARGLRSDIDRERALGRFDSDTDALLAIVDAADGLDLARVKVLEPFLPFFKLPLGVFIEVLGQHNLRHVLQAERAVADARGAA